jgi:hypothetical protein
MFDKYHHSYYLDSSSRKTFFHEPHSGKVHTCGFPERCQGPQFLGVVPPNKRAGAGRVVGAPITRCSSFYPISIARYIIVTYISYTKSTISYVETCRCSLDRARQLFPSDITNFRSGQIDICL